MFRFGFGFGFPGFILIAFFIRFIVIGAIAVFVVRHFRKSGVCKSDALRILDYRFANGEITEEEYLKRKSVLTK